MPPGSFTIVSKSTLDRIVLCAPSTYARTSGSSRLEVLRSTPREQRCHIRTLSTRPAHWSSMQSRVQMSHSVLNRGEHGVLSCNAQHRHSFRRGLKTVQQADSKQKLGPFSVFSAFLFVSVGCGLYFYFRYEKERMERKRIAEATKGVGKPKVGGTFELVDHDGQVWNSREKMDGKFALVYFGFSHCPDICPEELDKMASMLDIVHEAVPTSQGNPELLPIFITCDPARDTPPVLKSYLREFHPAMIGLTGAWEQIKTVCKLYRVYFSTPPGVQPGQDYLVDHSIYFYLMDPEGDFVEAIGRQHTAEQGAKLITDHMSDWRGKIKKA